MKQFKDYPKKNFSQPTVAIDVAIFSIVNGKFSVLLMEMNKEPFIGSWALPGGIVHKSENLTQAVERHLKVRAGIENVHIEQVYTFGDPDRDPKGWVVSVAYMALVPQDEINVENEKAEDKISWFPTDNLPDLAYDHEKILKTATNRLRAKLEYTNIVHSLLPQEFTLTELQNTYETILGENLDKRNFRKKILSIDILEDTGKQNTGGAHRPAKLYTFVKKSPELVEIL